VVFELQYAGWFPFVHSWLFDNKRGIAVNPSTWGDNDHFKYMTSEVGPVGRTECGGIAMRYDFKRLERGADSLQGTYTALHNCHTVTARLSIVNGAAIALAPIIVMAAGAGYGFAGVLLLNLWQIAKWWQELIETTL
jgi:hypothetical protein